MKKKKKKIELKLCDIIDNEIKTNSIRQGFPRSALFQIDKIKSVELTQHKDFTKIPFVTIDGEDSRDFDDAVWSHNENGITKIMIAISDVSFYIKKNDPLDIEAKKRGNSFYFPDRVIPMFPEEISNDVCSLIPNKERACIVLEITIQNLKIKNFNFHRAKIISIARLTYTEVDKIHSNNLRESKFFFLINSLYKSYEVLKRMATNRNKINFDTDEYEIIGKINEEFNIIKKKKIESYRLIEEFMIAANTCVAKFLKDNKLNSIFRSHEKPKLDKIQSLKKILRENNIYNNERFNNQKDFNTTLKAMKENKVFLNEALLRTQSKAVYSNKNEGHFGLGLDFYTHFTSPIRRYSDLNVHRDLVDFFFERKRNKIESNLFEHLTSQEKKSDIIERKILERACSLYLRNQKKKYFKGIVDGIEPFGIFVRAIDLPFSCLVKNRFNNYWNKKSSRTENKFRIGQMVTFKIKRNNIKTGKILAEDLKILNEKL